MNLMLAAVTGQSLVWLVITIVVVGCVFWLLNYLIGAVALPEPFAKIARIVLIVLAVLFLINALLSLIGKPLITW